MTPIANNGNPRHDPQILRRVPTLDQLMSESVKKRRREQRDARKRQKLDVPASQASQTQQSQALEDLEIPNILSASSKAPVTPERRSATEALPSAPTESSSLSVIVDATAPPTGDEQPTPTASAVKRKTFGSVLSLGSLGFSSQFDVESNVDDISRFMKDDVDDVFI